jgi:ribulose-phosphate 3-epimerase
MTLGPAVVKAIRKVTKLSLDVHLMITDPDQYAPVFIEAGADQISVHQEACPHLDRTLRTIQSEGARAGVVINPATPVGVLDEVLEFVDYVLVMSVNPGFGAQRFLPNALRKIRTLDLRRKELGVQFAIEIDGGISPGNVTDAVRAGCDWLVAGSSVFGSDDPAATVTRMQQLAREARMVHV